MKKIITKEIISLVQNSYNEAAKVASDKPLCVPAELNSGFTIAIGRVKVTNGGKNTYLTLADEVNKSYMQDWKKDIGNVFVKDCKKENLGVYYKYFGVGFEALLKRLSDDELEEFNKLGFSHLKLGDYYYMIVKVIPANDTYSFFDRIDEDFTVPVETADEEEEYKEEEQEIESLSLF